MAYMHVCGFIVVDFPSRVKIITFDRHQMLEILCGMLYRYHVKLVIFVAGSYMQVKFLLLIALAMLFSFIIVVN